MPEIRCHACGNTFLTWDDLANHVAEKAKLKDGRHKKTKWVKNRIHKNAVTKLKQIGQKKEFEPPQKLTPEQLEAKHEAKYELSGQTKYVPIICPRCKTGSRQFLEIEHVDNLEALREGNCYVKLCEGCR